MRPDEHLLSTSAESRLGSRRSARALLPATLTTEAQRAIDLLQERRTALISAAVTDQIDVRSGAPVSQPA